MQRIFSTTLGSVILSVMALSVHAQQANEFDIPEKIKANILKRHPKAIDFHASHQIHYKRKLLEVGFKEEGSDSEILELYREDGHLFTQVIPLEGLGLTPAVVKESLTNSFPGYTFKKAELIANPNGAGEEYTVFLTASGINWKVSIDDKGNIEDKNQY